MSEVKVVKLVTGEELISEVTEVDNTSYILKNPCIIIATKEGYGIAPWAFVSKEATTGIEIKQDKFLYITEPVAEFEQQYTSAFSPVVAPSSKIITPGDLKITT